jgi:hypothetical protein
VKRGGERTGLCVRAPRVRTARHVRRAGGQCPRAARIGRRPLSPHGKSAGSVRVAGAFRGAPVRWGGMGRDGMGWAGLGWAGLGWDGMGADGTGRTIRSTVSSSRWRKAGSLRNTALAACATCAQTPPHAVSRTKSSPAFSRPQVKSSVRHLHHDDFVSSAVGDCPCERTFDAEIASGLRTQTAPSSPTPSHASSHQDK